MAAPDRRRDAVAALSAAKARAAGFDSMNVFLWRGYLAGFRATFPEVASS